MEQLTVPNSGALNCYYDISCDKYLNESENDSDNKIDIYQSLPSPSTPSCADSLEDFGGFPSLIEELFPLSPVSQSNHDHLSSSLNKNTSKLTNLANDDAICMNNVQTGNDVNLLSGLTENTSELPNQTFDNAFQTEKGVSVNITSNKELRRRSKNKRASQKLREKKKREEEYIIEKEKELVKKNNELKEKAKMKVFERKLLLKSLQNHISVVLNSSTGEMRKFLLHYAITVKYIKDPDYKGVLGEVAGLLKEAIGGHQNSNYIESVLTDLVEEQWDNII